MGLGTRYFIINEDDSLKRVPVKKIHRLFSREPGGRFPEYAGERVRSVAVILEFVQRKPIAPIKIDYYILTFNSEGWLDEAENQKEMRLASDLLGPGILANHGTNVVNARDRFAKKRYAHKYMWQPTPDIEKAILCSIFDN